MVDGRRGSEVWQLGVCELRAAMLAGELSATEVVTGLLERIDACEPAVLAWAALDPEEALLQARATNGAEPRSMGDVPVGVKDIFFTRGLPTRANSRALDALGPTDDADAVALLRAQGAVVLGKLHTTEFAGAGSPPTRNPWNLAHTPGGSSSGSAAAVAAGMVPCALGSQTGGSTLRPAAYVGVVGYKGSYGAIPVGGMVPLAPTFDHVGVITRSVDDVDALVHVLAGTAPTAGLERPRRPRLGLLADWFEQASRPDTWAHHVAVVERLATQGAEVEELRLPEGLIESIQSDYMTIFLREVADCHHERFAHREQDYGKAFAAMVRRGLDVPRAEYEAALARRPAMVQELADLCSGVDALLTPTTPAPAPAGLERTGDARFQVPWSYAGFPTVTVPVGMSVERLPLGLQLGSLSGRDAPLLLIAAWCEDAVDFREWPPITG